MTIRGTSRPIPTIPTGHRQCRRCGIVREARRTRAEVRGWAA